MLCDLRGYLHKRRNGQCINGQLLVSNNREETEELPRDVVEGYEDIVSGLKQDNATWLSGAV